MRTLVFLLGFIIVGYSSPAQKKQKSGTLQIKQDAADTSFLVFRKNSNEPILTQIIKKEERPYIHPIIAPDGKGEITEFRPGHHLHQTGIFWGLKRVNERDNFMNYKSDYWRFVSKKVVQGNGDQVKWQTVYETIDSLGNTVMVETQNWTMRDFGTHYILDLEWKGEAKVDVTMGKFYVGGLFVRMPWKKGYDGDIINAAGKKNREVEAQRAIWSDVGITTPGRTDRAHMAIFDHPDNKAFPTPWRYDSQLGLGPSRQIMEDWTIPKGNTEVIRYRIMIYTGEFDAKALTDAWKKFAVE